MSKKIQKKVAMLGAYGVGKTSLVARFVHSRFSDKYHTTVGVKIDRRRVELGDTEVNLMLWDIAGEDSIQQIRMSYLRGAAGYLLVCDGTRKETVQVAMDIRQRVEETFGPLPFLLLINKCDLESMWVVSDAELDRLRGEGVEVLLTSALTGESVEQAFLDLTAAVTA